MPHSKIEQTANPFALDSNTNVEYDEAKWRFRGEANRLEHWKTNESKDLVWKPRKVPLAEAGKYFFVGDLIPFEELEKQKLESLEKGAEQIVKEVSVKDEYAEEKDT